MSPRTKKQFEEIREERKQQIMHAALILFANKGFDATSISMIAKEAGISKGLMYNYFESKEKLIVEIMDGMIEEMLSMFDPNHDGVLEAHEMKNFIHIMLHHVKENQQLYKLYFHVIMQPKVFALIEGKLEEIIATISLMVEKYFENMAFENPKIEALLFTTMLDGLFFDYVLKPELFPLDEIETQLIKQYCTKKSKS